jgi:predicted secreted protein
MKSALSLATLLLLAFVLASAALAEDLGARVASVCSACHSVGRVCGKLGSGQDYWKTTVARMIDNGAALSPSEVSTMAAYLAGQNSGAAPFCK